MKTRFIKIGDTSFAVGENHYREALELMSWMDSTWIEFDPSEFFMAKLYHTPDETEDWSEMTSQTAQELLIKMSGSFLGNWWTRFKSLID